VGTVIDEGDNYGIGESKNFFDMVFVYDGRVVVRNERFRAGVFRQTRHAEGQAGYKQNTYEKNGFRPPGYAPKKTPRLCVGHVLEGLGLLSFADRFPILHIVSIPTAERL
jgi:hypothetical protein